MKKICLTMTIAVFLLICINGLQAQTTQPKLNQVELMKQLIGTWQANVGKDTIEVWECQQYGKAFIINVHQVIKGQKIPLYINNLGFSSKEDKFKGYTLWSDGGYSTWIGLFNTEKKFSTDMVQDFNPTTTYAKFESIIENPKEWTWRGFNKDGVKISEVKFIKVE
jgi:hypothetical protein